MIDTYQTLYPVNIQLFRFPTTKIREAVVQNFDGSYTILIAEWLSREDMQKAYLHALWHIQNNDFYSQKSVQEIEREAHGWQ